jgi:hypothetical protein
MNYLWFTGGFVACYIFIELGKNILIKESFVKMEHRFLLGAINLLQYKYQALQLMEIVYERAAEDDPKYLEEKKQVLNKIEEKYDLFANLWIVEMQKIVPYNLQYKNWKEALEYADKLFNKRH